MIHLEQPSIAVNDLRVAAPAGKPCTRYHMWRTWDLSTKRLTPRSTIITYVSSIARSAPDGHVKNLIISCHGGPGSLGLGEGFGQNDIGLFQDWEGLFRTIWILGCQVARDDGRFFCGNLAFLTRAFVIASTEIQTTMPATFPYGYIGEFEGLVCAFEPEHGRILTRVRFPSAWMDSDGNWHEND